MQSCLRRVPTKRGDTQVYVVLLRCNLSSDYNDLRSFLNHNGRSLDRAVVITSYFFAPL
jgi:hypothetical protein